MKKAVSVLFLSSGVLTGPQAAEPPVFVTSQIDHIAEADFNSQNTHPPLSDSLNATGQNALWEFNSQLTQEKPGIMITQSSFGSDFQSPYTGTVVFDCERHLAQEVAADMRCLSNWLYQARVGEGYKLSLSLHGRSTQSPEPLYITDALFLSAQVRVNNQTVISHRNGAFVQLNNGLLEGDDYSVTLSSGPGSNDIHFSAGSFASNVDDPHILDAEFTLNWLIEGDQYRFDGEAGSDSFWHWTRKEWNTANTIDVNGNTVYEAEGMKRTISGLLPVDIARDYLLSGKFRSVGSEPSFMYFGIETYDADKQLIESYMGNRKGSDNTVTEVIGNRIEVSENFSQWSAADAPAHQRVVGIYFDGDTSKRADHYVLFDNNNTFSTALADGAWYEIGNDYLLLNEALPQNIIDQIVPGVTVIKNHVQSATHIYVAGGNVAGEWTDYQGTLSGIAWDNSHDAFRPETRYVKVYVSANWDFNANATLQFDDILLQKSN